MRSLLVIISFLLVSVSIANNVIAQTESDYYKISTIKVPDNIVLEAGGISTLPDGSLAVGTRHGEIWMVKNGVFKKFGSGLHEILGLAYRDGAIYTVQRTELTRVTDIDNDGKADKYETVYRWGVTGNYHEYSYGPVIAPDGSMFVTTNVAFEDYDPLRAKSYVPWRGWTLKITPDGKMEPWATGMRSPCGTGWIDNSFFYADNQGDWIGSGGLVEVNRGDFTGCPAGLDWAALPNSPVTVRKQDIYSRVDPQSTPIGGPYPNPENKEDERGERLYEIAKEVKGVKLPAVWLPHGVLGTSLSDVFTDQTNGKFGPFAGQAFVGDMGQSRISRVFLEKVKGVYQGAAIDFRSGFESGVLRMSWGQNGELYVGQTNRGWGSTGSKPYGLQVLTWTGKMPFEMKAVRAMPDGFEIEFTMPVDEATAADLSGYAAMNFIYKYHPAYGSPVVDEGECPVKAAIVSDDKMRIRLVVDSLKQYLIHELKLTGIKNKEGQPLLHNTAYYTLNEIPDGEKIVVKQPNQEHTAHTPHQAPTKPTQSAQAQPTPKRVTKMPQDWKAPDKTIVIGTLPGLKFDQSSVTVKAGSKVKLTFKNTDDMMHNLVIVMPGTATSVGEQALNLGVQASKLNYVPDSKNVLFHTKVLSANTSETIYFTAPLKPGKYTYVCTYPGHYLIMQGTLEVVK